MQGSGIRKFLLACGLIPALLWADPGHSQIVNPSIIVIGSTPIIGGSGTCAVFNKSGSAGCDSFVAVGSSHGLLLGGAADNAGFVSTGHIIVGTGGTIFDNGSGRLSIGSISGSNFFNIDSTNSIVYFVDLNGHIALNWAPGAAANTGVLTGDSSVAFGWNSSATNASFPAIDTGLSRDAAGVVDVGNGIAQDATGVVRTRSFAHAGSPPSFTGTCTAPASSSGGNTAGTFTVAAAGACAGGTYIMTFAFTAANGWTCDAEDRTTVADTVQQTASSQTTATFKATVANNDVVGFKCAAF